tara:strand:+ start:1952 stop:2167 length:216 start_codon:yes stop_codon:yes gene_type:complete
MAKEKLIFTKEVNPLNKNSICIFENGGWHKVKRKVIRKRLLFQVDKNNFVDDLEFNCAVKFIVEALNKNIS